MGYETLITYVTFYTFYEKSIDNTGQAQQASALHSTFLSTKERERKASELQVGPNSLSVVSHTQWLLAILLHFHVNFMLSFVFHNYQFFSGMSP